jgi:hypothetical protein
LQKLTYFIIPLILGILIVSCEKDDTSVIDPILTFATIDSVKINPQSIDTSRVSVNFTVYISSADPISSVTAKITGPAPENDELGTIHLTGNGLVYSGTYDSLQSCRFVGTYGVEFVAITNTGLPSNTVTGSFSVMNSLNVKPVVSIVYAPDSLQKPSGNPPDTLRPAFLQIQVNDPNGICDISTAYFNSVNPNGIPNPFNPFTMFDNGNPSSPSCETVGNDGKYSLCIFIGSTATLGDYIFKFNARDRTGAVSDTLYKTITVYP